MAKAVAIGAVNLGTVNEDGGMAAMGNIEKRFPPGAVGVEVAGGRLPALDLSGVVQENTHPEKLYGFKVNFTTKDANGDIFNEPHTVDGPTGSFNNPLNSKVVTGNIHGPVVVVPLNSKNSSGAYFLKFHLPQPSSSVMFVTFCEKSNKVKDGYYDYTQGVPDKYRDELKNWVFDMKGRELPKDGKTYTKDLVFRVKGIDTNVASASAEFTVSFVSVSSRTAIGIESGLVNS